MNYFYSTDGRIIKKNIVENFDGENEIKLIDYLNKIDNLAGEVKQVKLDLQELDTKYNLLLDKLPHMNENTYKILSGTSTDWKINNNIIYLDVNYDNLATTKPYVYVNITENSIINERYLYTITNISNNKFRVYLYINIDDKLKFTKNNLGLNYLVIG